MSTLTYRADLGALELNECCIVASNAGAAGWRLVFKVRTTEGHEQKFRVAVNPNGPPCENGPLGRTWGLARSGPGEWQVSPSINFDVWHETPKIVGVPENEPWMRAP